MRIFEKMLRLAAFVSLIAAVWTGSRLLSLITMALSVLSVGIIIGRKAEGKERGDGQR